MGDVLLYVFDFVEEQGDGDDDDEKDDKHNVPLSGAKPLFLFAAGLTASALRP